VTCNSNCLIETEGLLKASASDMHSKSGNVWETVQDSNVVTTDCSQGVLNVPFTTTFSDFQEHDLLQACIYCKPLKTWCCVQSCSSGQDFNYNSTSCSN